MIQKFEQFGKYLLLEKLATGGMAEVFLARAQAASGISKFVAIKRILPQYADSQEFIDMFKGEAKIAVNLSHSNIVSIYDFGIQLDQLYLVMDYVEGRNLRQILNKLKKSGARLQIDQALYIVKEVAAGLDHAHRCLDGNTGKPLNITHRDMSPQNVMVSFEGEIKIVDFGIAKAESQIENTRAGTLKGKFGYMSPEQADGQNVDLRTDIFSLGIVIWELLANDRLFVASNEINTLRKIRDCQVPSLRKLNPNISNELERITMKALARDRNLRYQTAAAMHRDLNRFLNRQYPEFSSQDFATFIKNQFAEEIFSSRQRLVEYSNLAFSTLAPPPPQAVSAPVAKSQVNAGSKTTPDTTSFVSENQISQVSAQTQNVLSNKSSPSIVTHSTHPTNSIPPSISDIDLSQDSSEPYSLNKMNTEGGSSSVENSSPHLQDKQDKQDKTAKYDFGSLVTQEHPSAETLQNPSSQPHRLDEQALLRESNQSSVQAVHKQQEESQDVRQNTVRIQRPSLSPSSTERGYTLSHANSRISTQTLIGLSFVLFILSLYIFLAKYYPSDMLPLVRALHPYLQPIHNIVGLEEEKTLGSQTPPRSPTNLTTTTIEKTPLVSPSLTPVPPTPPVLGSPNLTTPPVTETDPPSVPENKEPILITSTPSGADIMINHVATGSITPSLVNVPTSTPFSLTLTRTGYTPYHRENIRKDTSNRLSATLQPALVGYLDIDVSPPQNVRLLVNGKVLINERLPVSNYPVPAETPVIVQAIDTASQQSVQQIVKVPKNSRLQILLDLRRSGKKNNRQPTWKR